MQRGRETGNSMIFDIVVILALAASAAIAYLRGFTREFLTILGIVGGLAAAYIFGPMFQPLVRGFFGAQDGPDAARFLDLIPYPLIADVLTYGTIFVLVVVVLSLFSHWLSEIISNIGLGPVDRVAGVAFGLARGVVLLSILYLPVHLIIEDPVKAEWFKGSRTQGYIAGAAESIASAVPGIKEHGEDSAKDVTRTAEKAKETHDLFSSFGLFGSEDKDKKKTENGADQNEIAPAAGQDRTDSGYNDRERRGLENLIEQKSGFNE